MSNYERQHALEIAQTWPEGCPPVRFGALLEATTPEIRAALTVVHPEPKPKHYFGEAPATAEEPSILSQQVSVDYLAHTA